MLRRSRARRLRGLGAGGGAGLLAFLALGCPEGADLDPGNYTKPGYGTGGTGAGGGSTAGSTAGGNTASCDTACIKDIFQTNGTLCKLCHNGTGLKSAMLDLAS